MNGKVDIFWRKNPATPGPDTSRFPDFQIAESDEVLMFKVTCLNNYQLIGNVFHLCVNGYYPFSIPSDNVCKSKFINFTKNTIFYIHSVNYQ